MAGLQHCCRKSLIFNTFRLINRNGTLLQPCRKRHHLVFQICSSQNRMFSSQKSKLLFNTNRQQLIFRLASTEAPVTKSESVPSNSEKGAVQSSNSNVVIDESSLPPAPTVETNEIPDLEFVSTGLKEASFESLGLGSSWWPPGLIQSLFEFLHVNYDLEWWQTIIAVTLVTRILLFPVNISIRRDNINLVNNLPEMEKLSQKMTDARVAGDYYAVAVATQDFQKFIKEKNIKNGFIKTALIQGPVFISMFSALKGMANAPVESLKTGGLFWFTDMTVPDPYFILPVVLTSTLIIVMELGIEGSPTHAQTHMVKWGMRGAVVILGAISSRFSSCITWYWTVSNLVLLCQAGVLKIPSVSKYCKLPERINYTPRQRSASKKGFIEGFKEGLANAKITKQMEDRERMNLMAFQKAGTGPVPRTFKKNPLLENQKKS